MQKRCISPMSKALSLRSAKSAMKVSQSSPRGRRTRGGPDNSSCKFRGVRQRTWGKWVSEISELNRGKRTWLGTFATAEAAAMAYDEAAVKLFGSDAKINFPEKLPQVSCPVQATAPTSEIPEEGIVELQQGEEDPPAMAYDKAAGKLSGGYAKLSENIPQVSCPVHTRATTSKDTLIYSEGIKTPGGLTEMEQVACPPGPEFSLTTIQYDCLINDLLIDNYDYVTKKQSDVARIVNHVDLQGDKVGKNEGNLGEKLIVELPKSDDSSLWDEIMATTDLEKIKNPEDFSPGDLDDVFKDILEDDLGIDISGF
ncbi:hypothetical protein ACET3Z_015665 [Daucus carota]